MTSRKNDLSGQCKKKFDCEIAEVPALKEQFDKVAEESLTNAEKVLGLREGEPTAAPEESAKPVEKTAVRRPVRKPVTPKDEEDDDGFGL